MAAALVLPVRRRSSGEGEPGASPVLGSREQLHSQRPPAEAAAVASKAGRQVLFEALQSAWSPARESALSGSDMNDGVKLTVKNTFIDVDSEDDDPGFHYSGAKTCTARLSDPVPTDMCAEELSQTLQNMQPQLYEETPMMDRIGTANGFFGAVPKIPAPSMPPPAFPAPAAPAPGTFGIQQPGPPGPPPNASPRANFGQQLFVAALSGKMEMPQQAQLQQVGGSPGSSPNQQMMQTAGVSMVSSEGGQINYMQPVMMMATPVINTPVINVQVPASPAMAQATTMSPTASVGACATATAVAAPVVSGLASAAPSKGSQLHGQITEDGQPACQPCAWFHKVTGCQNGANCTRCHLCPEGELKLRKKQKLARLRNAEASGGPVLISPASESAADASAALSSSGAMLGTPEQGHKIISPRWADIDPEEEQEDQRGQRGQNQRSQGHLRVPTGVRPMRR